jgi:glc operon protein GlcG
MLEMTSRSVPSVLTGLYRRARPAIVGFSRPSTQQGRTSMALTLDEANRVLEATLAKAKQLNIKVSAAVVDAGGRLVAFQRMDNAIWASAYGSQGKAVASAAFGRTSGEMQARADQPTPRGINAASGGEMIMGQGAVPIIRNGVVEGACGVGGGTSQEDEDCARAGVEALGR